MNRQLPRIHAVTNEGILGLSDYRNRAAELTRSSQVALHVRGTLEDRQLTAVAELTRQICAPSGTGVWINDRADIARIVGMHGVHLPQHGLPSKHVREIVGAELFVGRSVHSLDEARAAEDEGVDYVFLGPIWDTPSHPQARPLGLGAISRMQGTVPIIAIGGITPERARAAGDAGAYGVAAISALWHAADRASALERMLLSFTP